MIRIGRDYVNLDGQILELDAGAKLFARTDSGWWRIRSRFGITVAYRTRSEAALTQGRVSGHKPSAPDGRTVR